MLRRIRMGRRRRCFFVFRGERPRPDKRLRVIRQWGLLGRMVPVGRISGTRHPAMGLTFGTGGRVPFTMRAAEYFSHWCGERDKGSGRAPLINPRGPARKSVLCTALTSRVPDCGRLDSTYSPLPGLAPCLGSPLSAIHGVQTLSFTLRFADFSGDTTPRCQIAGKSKDGVAVGSFL